MSDYFVTSSFENAPPWSWSIWWEDYHVERYFVLFLESWYGSKLSILRRGCNIWKYQSWSYEVMFCELGWLSSSGSGLSRWTLKVSNLYVDLKSLRDLDQEFEVVIAMSPSTHEIFLTGTLLKSTPTIPNQVFWRREEVPVPKSKSPKIPGNQGPRVPSPRSQVPNIRAWL